MGPRGSRGSQWGPSLLSRDTGAVCNFRIVAYLFREKVDEMWVLYFLLYKSVIAFSVGVSGTPDRDMLLLGA